MGKQSKKTILIMIGAYLPGYKVGGPGISVANLVEALGDEYDFRIMCEDHDLGEKEPYKGIKPRTWTKVGKASVYYVPKYVKKETVELCKEADLVYVCGCFNGYARQVLSAKSKNRFTAPVVIAAMGLFDPGAYNISGYKKRAYMMITGLFGYYDDVSWSATTEEEAGYIAAALHCGLSTLSYHIAKDLPRLPDRNDPKISKKKKKTAGRLSVIFLSRISPVKNLLAVTKILSGMPKDQHIDFSIYGPIEDKEYYEICRNALDTAGENITWAYRGEVTGKDVFKAFSGSDVFLFPTLGENFGHVISEALCAGCPVITSDRTPWNDLSEHGAGFSLGLPDSDEDYHEWVAALKHYAEMSADEMSKVSENCISYIRSKIDIDSLKAAYRDMFEDEMEG